jgi:hypothetical protein
MVRNVSITSWNVTDFKSQSIILKVMFSNPMEISIFEVRVKHLIL